MLEAAVSALQKLQARRRTNHYKLPHALMGRQRAHPQPIFPTQGDLSYLLQLRRHTAEFQLAVYPGSGAQYHRHRDALPDDGSEVRGAERSC